MAQDVEPIGFPGSEPTETQKAEHERHSSLGENRWFTCPLCDDESDDEVDGEWADALIAPHGGA